MKINFGEYKNRNIITGDNKMMRPTQSRAKSVIFNVLDIKKEDKVVDLFSGTGALGFEALSLGAKTVYFNDNNRESVQAMKKTINLLNLNENINIKVFDKDFRLFLKNLNFKPTILFFDPPFIAQKYYEEGLNYLFNHKIMDNKGVIILEKMLKVQIDALENFRIIKNKIVGEKEILFLGSK